MQFFRDGSLPALVEILKTFGCTGNVAYVLEQIGSNCETFEREAGLLRNLTGNAGFYRIVGITIGKCIIFFFPPELVGFIQTRGNGP